MKFLLKSLKVLFLLGFIIALSEAFPGYIRSSFLKEFVDVKWVAIFFTIAAFFTLIAITYYPYFIKRLSNYRLSIIILSLAIVGYLLLALTHSTFIALFAFILAYIMLNLIWINMDVFVERLTKNKTTGKTRTVYNTFINFGWVASPLIVGLILKYSNYRTIYLISTFFLITVLAIIITQRKRLTDHINYIHHRTWVTLSSIWKRVDLRRIFSIAILLQLFYVMAVIYIPIHLHENIGFSWLKIGGIFTFMLLPFILFEIPAGSYADKYMGERKILIIGFSILIISTALIFFIKSNNPIVWAMVLFLTRCGAALIEAMRESYFFKIVDVQDIDYIDFFRSIKPLGHLIGAGLSTILLLFLPLPYIFLLLSFILLSGLYFTWRLKTI